MTNQRIAKYNATTAVVTAELVPKKKIILLPSNFMSTFIPNSN
ncbi:MAG: hypothetical protein SCG72_01600 [Nitrosarchaeum sp.]|nr:hypothetical protein [Nitrosarchaeum sp.]